MDFNDGDDHYANTTMAIEMGTMGREYECARQSQVPGTENTHPDISNFAWEQVQQVKARYFVLVFFFMFSETSNSSSILCVFQVVSGGITTGGNLDIDEIILDDDVDVTRFD